MPLILWTFLCKVVVLKDENISKNRGDDTKGEVQYEGYSKPDTKNRINQIEG